MIATGNYNLKQLKQALGITDYQWKKRQQDLIEHLMLFFDLDIIISNDNNYTFIIYQQFSEYEPLPRKGHNEKRKEHYRVATHSILEKEPYNTGSNVARTIVRNNKQYENDVWRTIANYNRIIIKEDYIKTDERVWAYIDENSAWGYSLLNEEEESFLKGLFAQGAYDKVIAEAHIYSQQIEGVITKKEADKKCSQNNSKYYSNIFKTFKEKYGKMPQSVPKWVLKEQCQNAF